MLLILLLTTVAFSSTQFGFVSSAHIQTNKGSIDNNVLSNIIPSTRHYRQKKFVKISHSPPETARHNPGVDLELTCGVMGSPTPQIQWMRNGEPIDDVYEESNELIPVSPLSVARVFSILIISSPSPNPEDVYTCVGTSGDLKAKASTTVLTDSENAEDYLQQLLALPSKPRITYFFQTIIVQDFGSNLVLPCRVTNGMDAQLYWTDSSGDIVLGNKKTKVLPSGDLFIPNVQWSDMGDWTCVVKNFLGEDSQSTFFYPARSA